MTGTNRPTVSVALPVYNGEQFLDEAVSSVLTQDLESLELVICDNGSDDRTEEICRRWEAADPRVRYLRSADNLGAARNFNRAFAACSGEFFKWMAADDEIESTFLSSCVAALEADPSAVLAYPQVVDIDGDGVELNRWGSIPRALSSDAGDRVADVILNESRAFPIFGLARHSAMAKTRLIKPWTGSDYLVLADLAIQGRFVEVPAPLFRHREHEGRSTRAYKNFRERAAWFDTRRSGRFAVPRWSNVIGFAVTPLRCWRGPGAVATTFAAVVRHAWPQWKMLVRELLWAAGDAFDSLKRLARSGR